MPPESLWPANRPEFNDLPTWLASALPGKPVVRGPIQVLRVKQGGGTALFEADGQPVVGKHAEPALFPAAAAIHATVRRVCPDRTAPLLAYSEGPSWQRSAFGFIPGPTAAQAGQRTLVEVAATLGQVQACLATTDLFGLPAYSIANVPDTLAEDLTITADQNPTLLDEFLTALPVLRHHAELLAEALPISLDHPDVNDTNAIVTDQSITLLDWEEATVGCPLFSLPRLLADAEDEQTRTNMIDAYLDAFFSGQTPGTRRLLDLATIVAPLKLAIEARTFARALALPHPHTNRTHHYLTHHYLTESLHLLTAGDHHRAVGLP